MTGRLVLLSIALSVCTRTVNAQSVITVTDAPFSATWTTTTEKAGIATTTKTVAARLSDGSVYEAYFKDGIIDHIFIEDGPHEKWLEVRPQTKQYHEMPVPHGHWITRTVEQHNAILKRWNKTYSRQTTLEKKDMTSLGTKTVDGMTVYGHHYVRSRDGVQTMDGDTWDSYLGLTYSSRVEISRDKRVDTTTLEELKHVEPDASLFVVPADYKLVQR